MEPVSTTNTPSLSSRVMLSITGALGAFLALVGLVPNAHAALTPIELTADVITGAQAGVNDSTGFLEGSLNNQYVWQFALMFIGFAVIVGVIMWMVKGHRRI